MSVSVIPFHFQVPLCEKSVAGRREIIPTIENRINKLKRTQNRLKYIGQQKYGGNKNNIEKSCRNIHVMENVRFVVTFRISVSIMTLT